MRRLPALLAAAALFLAASSAFASTPRVAQTATLLPTNNLLIAGGMDNNGTILSSSELRQTSSGNTTIAGGNMTVARASHTATVISNGLVLIAGGITTGGTILSSLELYNPATNSFASTGLSMGTARYNHTATLLTTGSVLLCGGQTTGGGVTNLCDYYTPYNAPLPAGGTCSAANGCVSNNGGSLGLLYARALHTASLLKDGTVWFAGGYNPGSSATNGVTDTTERFNPANGGSFGAAAPLASARAYHTATVMGDGRVLVAGGYNGDNVAANQGILDTEEIYDPIANSMNPASQMLTRREMHSAVLDADGAVTFFGGLGNITTTYVSEPVIAPLDQTVPLTFATLNPPTANGAPTSWITNFVNGLFLKEPVVGTIDNGTALFSDPKLIYPGGNAVYTPGNTNGNGLQANLAGVNVDCEVPGGPIPSNCGFIGSGEFMQGVNLGSATYSFDPLTGISPLLTNIGGNLYFGSGPGATETASDQGPKPIASGTTLSGTITIPLPVDMLGSNPATTVQGNIQIVGGSIVQASSYTATLTGGSYAFSNQTVVPDGGGGAQLSFPVTFTNLTGTVVWAANDDNTYVLNSGISIPDVPGDLVTADLVSTVTYVPSQLVISGLSLSVDVTTVIVHSMVFGSPEFYDPKTNQTTLTTPDGGSFGVTYKNARSGQTSTVLLNNDMLTTGGYNCANPSNESGAGTCGPLIAASRADTTYVYRYNNSVLAGSLQVARAEHTSTLLPNGTILVAGGTNGTNILSTAEIYTPTSQTSAYTKSGMAQVRDQHTSTLLPDGRVLIAGGFTTNSISSDATSGCEIYYPDTQVFIQTSSMTIPRYGHTATMLGNGTVLAIGGLSTGGTFAGTGAYPTIAEVFHSTTSSWESASINQSSLPPRRAHTATLLKDGGVLVIGGIGPSGALSTVYKYNPTNRAAGFVAQACIGAPTCTPLFGHSATLLFDGRVLVSGGNDGFGETGFSEIYDPVANTWTPTNPTTSSYGLLQPRFYHTATLLPNDTVMISGGVTAAGIVPTEIEVFHVDASSWAAGGVVFVSGPRAFHTMTLAPDGNVYALGGSNGIIGGAGVSAISAVDSSYFTAPSDEFSVGAPPSSRQSIIQSTASTPSGTTLLYGAGNTFTVNGIQFRGGTEASGGGAASANSSFSFPHLVLQQIDGSGGGGSQGNSGFVVDLTTQIYLNSGNLATEDTRLTVALPATQPLLPIGWYNARTGANDIYSNGAFVHVGPAQPTAAPSIASGTTLGVSSFSWTWALVPGGPGVVDGYNVYQATSGVFLSSAPQPTDGSNPYFIQTGLLPNSTGQIAVAAYTISGDGPLAISATGYTLSTCPVSVTIASVSFNTLLLQWNANTNMAGAIYEISESSDNFNLSYSTPVPTLLGLTSTYYTITGLQNSTTYYFRVRAFNTALLPSTFSNVVSTTTRNTVGNVGCGPNNSGDSPTSIAWNWNDAGQVIQYNVYDSSTGYRLTGPSGIPSGADAFHDTGLAVNSVRSIQVTAVTGAGEGPLSAPATCYTLAAVPGAGSPVMTSTETTSVSLNWTANGNPNGTLYDVVFTAYVGTTTAMSTFTTTGFSYYIPGLTPSTAYAASIAALNGENYFPPSSFLVAGTTWTLPAQPTVLTIQGTTPVSLSASWNQNYNSTSTYYQVTYATQDFNSVSPPFTAQVSTADFFSSQFTGSSVTIGGLFTSTTYWLRVQAENPFGQTSPYSTEASTITYNGGATAGSLAGVLNALGSSRFSGNLGNGRFIDMRSPGGAFTTDTLVQISSYSLTDPGHVSCPNALPGLGGTGVAVTIVDNPALQPTQPLYLTASYTNAEIGSASINEVALAHYDPATGTCTPLETSFNTTANTFLAELNHFSLYELVSVPVYTGAGTARVYPNPFHAATDSYVTIDQIPADARVRVFTLRGEKILDVSPNGAGIVNWRADNGAGRPVASGLYLIEIEANGTKNILKLAVIR